MPVPDFLRQLARATGVVMEQHHPLALMSATPADAGKQFPVVRVGLADPVAEIRGCSGWAQSTPQPFS